MTLIDTHAHLDHPDLAGDTAGVLARARAAGVRGVITIGTHAARTARYVALAEAWPEVAFTVGTHPLHAGEEPDLPPETYAALSDHPRCVGIGEAGLDYHHGEASPEVQGRVFRAQIAAARDRGLPLVIHARDADEDVARICEDEAARGPFRAVLHCFSSGEALARRGLDLGFSVSFSGIVTFKRSEELRRIAALVPEDRLLVETDAPYLAPEPHRGRRNEPAYVAHTLEALALARGTAPDALAAATTRNALRLFPRAAAAFAGVLAPASEAAA